MKCYSCLFVRDERACVLCVRFLDFLLQSIDLYRRRRKRMAQKMAVFVANRLRHTHTHLAFGDCVCQTRWDISAKSVFALEMYSSAPARIWEWFCVLTIEHAQCIWHFDDSRARISHSAGRISHHFFIFGAPISVGLQIMGFGGMETLHGKLIYTASVFWSLYWIKYVVTQMDRVT